MAEGVFKSLVSKPPYNSLIKVVDSCGTAGYHVGTSPDERTMATLEGHGIVDYRHAARQVSCLIVSVWMRTGLMKRIAESKRL